MVVIEECQGFESLTFCESQANEIVDIIGLVMISSLFDIVSPLISHYKAWQFTLAQVCMSSMAGQAPSHYIKYDI